jgi:hypothetical protein
MMIDRNGLVADDADAQDAARNEGNEPSDAAVQAALAGISANGAAQKTVNPAEMRYRMTVMIFASILLVFVALYVTSLAAGIEPEVALFRAGGACVVLAVLARVAVGIISDETRLVLNDRQIVAMARTGGVDAYLSDSTDEHGADRDSAGIEQPSSAAQAAGTGGKE